jgi:hypothetical protein
MITSTQCRATRTRGLVTGVGVTLLVLAPAAARAHVPLHVTVGPGPIQAFTPPSPSTAQPSSPTAPAASTPSSPTFPAGMPTPEMAGYAPPSDGAEVEDISEGTPLIPPNVEGAPQPTATGGYCYVGPHPADTRVVPGAPWDPTTGQHIRPYPPIDTRLFAYRDGCYYFTGDPRDFGYSGQTHSYYGAHPVLSTYGGGWCFMMGGHAHLWSPWSPYFAVVGPWYYWQGAYDPFFWSYWPYYSFYYRSYYPHYYGGGRFHRGGYRAAPPIHRVPASAWRGATPGHGPGHGRRFGADPGSPVTRGAPAMPMNRQGPGPSPSQAAAVPTFGRPAHGFGTPPAAATMASPGSRPFNPGVRPSPMPVQRPAFSPAPRPFSPGPSPSFSPGPRPSFSPSPRPSFSPSPRPSFSPSPRPSFSPPAGGGFRGGGMGSRGRH